MTILTTRAVVTTNFNLDFQTTFWFSMLGLTLSLALVLLFGTDFGALLSYAG
jgi:hypothetical protein